MIRHRVAGAVLVVLAAVAGAVPAVPQAANRSAVPYPAGESPRRPGPRGQGGAETPTDTGGNAPTGSVGADGASPSVSRSGHSGTGQRGGAAVLLAAGDIGYCESSGDEATARLLDTMDGTIAALGDTAYLQGSARDFANCYEPSWGRHRARTRPAIGNHEYHTGRGAPYFAYFGAAAGHPARGYYSYNLGEWHVVVLNSNCALVGCAPGSAQERWLRADLAADRSRCTLAYWHHPLFTSGIHHGPAVETRPLFQALYDDRAEVVLAGHNHNYERFAPQTPRGTRDTARGIRAFVVGSGGASHYGFGRVRSNSEVRDADTYGVLRLALRPGGYDWRFVPVAGRTFADTGTAACH